ncbi:SusC/RagA family TonB-linked outer membrane protein [Pedobacter sp. PLR]|uniref:SusC/RagA family TonB-linked outer membrane protein n=1 Tax=Pedobacter sp. PLR TaxID=2994465 RepID=UPI0022454315|nr:SusC/RagA family TonB-linked outer membrane protein [Pedobacter sp. PLR]MCX2453642.1 SusC/RagA family TonB-linked outer membrane protein [Pedobacter sp. PLR]
MNNFYGIIRTVIYSALFLIVFLLPASAQQKNSNKVTLNVRNGTLESILQSIMKQTSVRIVYNHELVQKAPRMNFAASNEDLKTVVRRLLKGSVLTFVLQDDVLVIGPKDEQEEIRKTTRVIKGQVSDNIGIPLSLVNISITGEQRQVQTDENGRFSIDIEEGNSISFSYVGFEKKTLKPQPGEIVNIKLKPLQNEMEEVVVTGYQEVSKRLSASSTFTLKAADIKTPGVPNITAMLQGKVPGLSVINTSGSPNAVPKLRLRGTSTLLGNANPIWVVDGIVRENPDGGNPDNVMGTNPSLMDMILGKESAYSKASLIGNSMSGLNVNDIESITFLKDASATAIYGTRAANGVIVVTTRKGLSGKPVVSYNFNTGYIQKPSYSGMKMMNSQQRVRFSREIYEDGLFYPGVPFNISYEGAFQDLMNRKITEAEFQKQVAHFETINTNWFDVLFQNSLNMSHNVNLSGGSEKVRYYSSLSYDNSKGSAKEDWQNRVGGKLGLNADLSSRLKLDFSLTGNQRNSNGYFQLNPLDYALKTSRTIGPDVFYPTRTPTYDTQGNGTLLSYNLKNEINESGSTVKVTEINASFTLNYRIIDGLRFNSVLGVNSQQSNAEQYATERSNYIANSRGYDYGSVVPGGIEEQSSSLPFGGTMATDHITSYNYTIRNSMEYTKRVFGERDQVNIFAGHEMRSVKYNGFSERVPGYLKDKGESFVQLPNSYFFFAPRKTNTVDNALSAFVSASYSFADKYILNANIRTDASNRFGQYSNSRFLPVWSIAARWNMIEEPWLKDGKVINALDLKASYGFQGNVVTSVGPDLIASIPEGGSPIDAAARQYILKLKSLPYPDLRWEKTRSYNMELHASLFNSFADFTIAYYDKRGSDIITSRKVPLEYGISTMYLNGGNMRNHGYEANLNLNPIRGSNFDWSVSVNVSKNFNKVEQGVSEIPYTLNDYLNGTAQVTGQPAGTFYVVSYKGLDPKYGMPLFNKIDDGSSYLDRTFMDALVIGGNRVPDISGGLTTSIRYKAFSMGVSFAFSLGSKRLLNAMYAGDNQFIPMPDQNMPAIFEQRWRKPGDEAFTNIPGFVSYVQADQQVEVSYANRYSRYYLYDHSDLNLVSGDFLRCRSMNLGYSLPAGWLKRARIKQMSVTATATNLFVIADKKLRGQDPETDGVGTTALPIVPAFNLGLSLSF